MPELVAPDPEWPARFEREAGAIASALGPTLAHPAPNIHHVGSTAVPGCAAKDVVDVLVEVPAGTPVDLVAAPLEQLGLVHRPDLALFLPERVFVQRRDAPALNVHVEQRGLAGAGRDGRLVFRDALRADDRLRDAYVGLKRRLATRHDDVDDYAEAKSDFVREVLASAAERGDHVGVHLRAEPADGATARRLLDDYATYLVAEAPGGFDLAADTPAPPEAFTPPRGTFLVAYDGVEPLGCGAVQTLDPGVAEIRRMWLEPTRRGGGLGGRMLVALERAARATGASVARLHSMRTLSAAIGMYRSHGYVEIDDYNGNPNATIWMEHRL